MLDWIINGMEEIIEKESSKRQTGNRNSNKQGTKLVL